MEQSLAVTGRNTRREPPSLSQLVSICERALDVTAHPMFLTPHEQGPSYAIACSGVARCRALVAAVLALHVSGHDQVTGVLIRTLYESWLAAMYGLLGGPDAVDELVDHYDFETMRLLKKLGRPVEGLPTGKDLSTWDIAQRLEAQMVAQGLPNPTFPSQAYKTLFAGESYNSMHGVAPFNAYVTARDGGLLISTEREESDESVRGRIALALAIFISGAQITRRMIGLDHSELDELAIELLDSHGAPAVDDTDD